MIKDTSIWLISVAIITTSCAVIKDSPNDKLIMLDKTDYRKLNGKYSNYPSTAEGIIIKRYPGLIDTAFKSEKLWSQIDGYIQRGNTDSSKKQTVTLEFISERKGIGKLWEGEKILKTKKIKGKIKDGYFYRRPYFVSVPLIPLLFKHKTFRYRIGLTDDKIVVDYRWNVWGAVIFGGFYASKGQSKSEFNRK